MASLLFPQPYIPGYRLQDGDQMNKESAWPAYSLETGITATGNNQGTARLLEATVSVITAGAVNTGVRLALPKPGWAIAIVNRSGSQKAVYPHASETIDGTSYTTIPDGAQLQLYCNETDWIVGALTAEVRSAARLQVQWVSGAVVQDDTIYFVYDPPYPGRINSATYFCNVGSFDLEVQINGVDVTGLEALAPTSIPTTTPASAANTFAAGQPITGIISSSSGSPTDALVSLDITWTG